MIVIIIITKEGEWIKLSVMLGGRKYLVYKICVNLLSYFSLNGDCDWNEYHNEIAVWFECIHGLLSFPFSLPSCFLSSFGINSVFQGCIKKALTAFEVTRQSVHERYYFLSLYLFVPTYFSKCWLMRRNSRSQPAVPNNTLAQRKTRKTQRKELIF